MGCTQSRIREVFPIILIISFVIYTVPAAPITTQTTNPIAVFALSKEGAKNFGTEYTSPAATDATNKFDEWKHTHDGAAELARYEVLNEISVTDWKDLPASELENEMKRIVDTEEFVVAHKDTTIINLLQAPKTDKPVEVQTNGKEVVKPDTPSKTSTSSVSMEGMVSAAYFANWKGYKNHKVADIPGVKQLTHLLYAFAKQQADGKVVSSDEWADFGDASTDVGGNIKDIYELKKVNRRLKAMLSIGGWTYSEYGGFAKAVDTKEKRTNFVNSTIDLVKNMGFDGADIDWEYPETPIDADNYIALVKELRQGFDAYSKKHAKGYHFEISLATPASPKKYGVMKLGEIAKFIDHVNIMTYDYTGSWDELSGHQANLFPSLKTPDSTPYSSDRAIMDYFKAGVPANKIVLGMGTYGRRFLSTEGLGKPFSKADGEGAVLYKDIESSGGIPSLEEFYDEEAVASGSYNAETKELISYDNEKVVEKKVEYIKVHKLGGAMWWETSGDKKGDQSLIAFAGKKLGKLQEKENLLEFPDSKYDNIKGGDA